MPIAELKDPSPSFKNDLDKADPNSLPARMRLLKIGSLLAAMPQKLCHKAAVAHDGYNVSTLSKIATPEDMRGALIFRALARVGGVTALELAIQAYGTTPGSGQIAVAPNGEIVVLTSDAWTDVDVLYLPDQYETVEIELPVATGVLTLPSWMTLRGAGMLLEAEATAGTITGKKVVLVPAAGLPATLQARLDLPHATVQFNNATDAVTKARVKLALSPTLDRAALYAAAADF